MAITSSRVVMARNIAEERDTIGITWRELSRRSGVSTRRLSKPTNYTVIEVPRLDRQLHQRPDVVG